ncbi:MAG: hypothetical protein Q9202_005030 [Teloschistes flavicans]
MLIIPHNASSSDLPLILILLILLLSNHTTSLPPSIGPEETAIQTHLQTQHLPDTTTNKNTHSDTPHARKRAPNTNLALADPPTYITTIHNWVSIQPTPASLTSLQNFLTETLHILLTLSPIPARNTTITLTSGPLFLLITLTTNAPPTSHALAARRDIPDLTADLVELIQERLAQARRGLVGLFRLTSQMMGLGFFIGVMQGLNLPERHDHQLPQGLEWGLVQWH